MRWFLNSLVLVLALGPAVAANAQVTTDPGALESLPKAAPHPVPPRIRPPVRHAPVHPHAPAPVKPSLARPVAPTVAAPLPVIPPAAPPPPVIPPPIAVPTLPPPAPPPVPVSATAAGAATALPGGLRVTFGTDSADLNPATQAALVALAATARQETGAINVLAHAPGVAEDPSSPRRLSVMRGMAARAVLINQGIDSTRIYVRALGPRELGDGPADRVDVLLGPTPTPAAPPQSPPQ